MVFFFPFKLDFEGGEKLRLTEKKVECSKWRMPWVRAWRWVIGKAKAYTDIWTFTEGGCVKHSFLSSSQHPGEVDVLAFILPTRKQKPREVEEFSQLYTAGQWQNQDVNLYQLTPSEETGV